MLRAFAAQEVRTGPFKHRLVQFHNNPTVLQMRKGRHGVLNELPEVGVASDGGAALHVVTCLGSRPGQDLEGPSRPRAHFLGDGRASETPLCFAGPLLCRLRVLRLCQSQNLPGLLFSLGQGLGS